MVDSLPYDYAAWDSGFEGGRYLVVGKFWPFTWVFQRPSGFRKKPWHQVYELAINDWRIPLDPLQLGPFCRVDAELRIRYQPTFNYAREHLEFLPDLAGQIQISLGHLLKDLAEQEIRRMATEAGWLHDGCASLETATANLVNEMLVLRGIHCRTRCQIEPQFAPADAVDLNALPPWLQQQAIYEEYLRRRREAKERILKDQTEEEATSRRLLMEREARLLELAQEEEQQQQARQAQELERLQAELARQEAQLQAQLASAARQREDELAHQAYLRDQQAAAEHEAREAEDAKLHAELAAQAARLAAEQDAAAQLEQARWQHEAELRQRRAAAEQQTRDAEDARVQAELAAEAARLAAQQAAAAQREQARWQHEAELRQQRAEAEWQALQQDLEAQRAELALEQTQQTEFQQHDIRRHEDRLVHQNWLRQMQTEAEIRARDTELEAQRLAEAARLAKQREDEARQREEQLRHETRLKELQLAAQLRDKQLELERLRAEMANVEAQLERQREYEARQQQEQARHAAQLRQWLGEQELQEKDRRLPVIAELETFLEREIGLLATERQRLRLEEEVHNAKLTRTQDFIAKTRRRITPELPQPEGQREG